MTCSSSRRGLLALTLCSPWLVRAQTLGARAGGEVLIGGTGAGLGPLQRVAEASGARSLIFVPNLGTGGGLKAIAAGAIDIAVAARRLNDDEKAKGLVERELFRTPIVWAVHEGVPKRGVTRDELIRLYAGHIQNWTSALPVRLVLRPETDTDTQFLKSLGPAMTDAVAAAQARPGVRVATTDADTTEALERIPGAVGVTTLGLVRAERRRVQVLEIDGEAPTIDSLRARRYPFAKSVFVVTRGSRSAAASEVLDMLSDRAAMSVLASIGCVSPIAT